MQPVTFVGIRTEHCPTQENVRAPRLLDRVIIRLRLRHYSLRTEQAYVGWIKRYIIFHGKRHPSEMGKAQVEAFLSALAVQRNVSASTQQQALAAILFLYHEVLGTAPAASGKEPRYTMTLALPHHTRSP